MVSLFKSVDKIYEDEAVVHLVLPPHPCKDTLIPSHSTYADLPLPPPILPSYWLAHRPITQSRFWPPEGEGGDRYKITTCRMAEGSKDPCISHVDASHGEWPRIESSLLFCNFFILSKSLRKAYFLRVKLGSLERKLPRLGIDIF